MIAAAAAPSSGYNWYDIVVLAAIVFGVWSGVRTGLTREIINVVGLTLMVVLGVGYYATVSSWLQPYLNLAEEVVHLIAFITITLVVYLATALIREIVHRNITKFKFGVVVENVGGAVAGAIRMLAIMVAVTLMLCLMRSDFWHEQVAQDSAFGSLVVARFPSVEELTKKHFKEKLWFMKKLPHWSDPNADESDAKKRK